MGGDIETSKAYGWQLCSRDVFFEGSDPPEATLPPKTKLVVYVFVHFECFDSIHVQIKDCELLLGK